ncbi:TerD family protein [Variovorax atrisoli]|uniref:TerD family protein n=1 Tax=Variovorax atrisoli TaxID=3394203 RepID=UPI0033980718
MNEIYLRRRMRLHVRSGEGGVTPEQLASMLQEIEQLGFVLTDEVVSRLSSLPFEDAARMLHSAMQDMRKLVGAHRQHEPLHPGFPSQVMALSEAQLYLNALSHYVSLRRMPDTDEKRPPLLHKRYPRIVALGSVEDFETICTKLAGSAVSLSEQDRADLIWFVRQYRADIFRLLPAKFPFKENLALLGAQLVIHVGTDERTQRFVKDNFRTATDVLRLAVALSGGDVSLAASTRFVSFSRHQRRMLLALLEDCGGLVEDMHRRIEPFKRLGERLHPGEQAKRYPKTAAAFDVVRNGLPVASFNSRVEQALAAGDIRGAALVLEDRPGEYARRLDALLRKSEEPQVLLQRFAELAPRVSTTVLLQVLAHFQARAKEGRLRVFFPKGDVAKVFALGDRRAAIDLDTAQRVVHGCKRALLARFAQLPPLGRCHVDPALASYVVPLSQRAASKTLRTFARGSRIPMSEGGFVRLFLWWMNGRSRVDIDLSVVLYGEDYRYVDTIAFYNLRGWGAHHSGDIVDAPKGASEFIDLDVQLLRAAGVRFVMMCINSYSGQAYCDLPECFAGWMSRKNLNSGEPFEARTVVDRVDLASDTRISLPLVLDLERREVLWADFALRDHPRFSNSVAGNLTGVSLMLRALHEMVKPDLHTLMSLHALARGTLVDTPAEADTRFGVDRGCTVTPLDGDEIRSSYLQ